MSETKEERDERSKRGSDIHNATYELARIRDAAVAMSDRCARSAVEVAYGRNQQETAEANALFLKRAAALRRDVSPGDYVQCPCKNCCDVEGREVPK